MRKTVYSSINAVILAAGLVLVASSFTPAQLLARSTKRAVQIGSDAGIAPQLVVHQPAGSSLS